MSDILYAPWRIKYILSNRDKKCIFCLRPSAENDAKHFILHRANHSFVILNMYPYNNGHLMVIPFKHVSSLNDLKNAELADLFQTVQLCEKVLKAHYNPDGINIGLNLGRAAGAGIDTHLHVHIIPRWNGDVNFMTAVNGTRVIPESFERTYSQLKKHFESASKQAEEQIDKPEGGK
jgi:ATP adenylyltransferase